MTDQMDWIEVGRSYKRLAQGTSVRVVRHCHSGLTVYIVDSPAVLQKAFVCVASEAMEPDVPSNSGVAAAVQRMVLRGSGCLRHPDSVDELAFRSSLSNFSCSVEQDRSWFELNSFTTHDLQSMLKLVLDALLFPEFAKETFVSEVCC